MSTSTLPHDRVVPQIHVGRPSAVPQSLRDLLWYCTIEPLTPKELKEHKKSVSSAVRQPSNPLSVSLMRFLMDDDIYGISAFGLIVMLFGSGIGLSISLIGSLVCWLGHFRYLRVTFIADLSCFGLCVLVLFSFWYFIHLGELTIVDWKRVALKDWKRDIPDLAQLKINQLLAYSRQFGMNDVRCEIEVPVHCKIPDPIVFLINGHEEHAIATWG